MKLPELSFGHQAGAYAMACIQHVFPCCIDIAPVGQAAHFSRYASSSASDSTVSGTDKHSFKADSPRSDAFLA